MHPKVTLKLHEKLGPDKEYVFEDSARCLVGRAADCDIQLPPDMWHADVSRHHCLLEIDPPKIRLRDLGSLNGTRVNGQRIGGRRLHGHSAQDVGLHEYATVELAEGDEVQVGSSAVLCVNAILADDEVDDSGQ